MIKLVNLVSFDQALEFVPSFCSDKLMQDINIIVPDKLSLFMEKHLFESLNISASFNLRVVTLDRLVKKNMDLPKTKQISKLGSIVLVHKILMDNSQNLSVLKNRAYSFGYAEEILNTIGQLKASKILVEEMLKFTHSNTQLQNKIHDLAIVFEQYETLKAGLLDATDQFLMCCLNLNKIHTNQNFLFVGFDDFTAVEYTAIEQLATSNEVIVLNYSCKSNNQHLYNDEIASQLKQIAYINQLPIEFSTFEQVTDTLKSYISKNIFGIKPSTFCDEQERVKIFACKDSYEEIDQVARDIRMKVLDGAKFSQFGVAVFNKDNLNEQLNEIFTKYELNFYLDGEMEINQSTLYKFVCDVLRLNLESYEVVHYIDIINSPFFVLDEQTKQALILKLLQINFKGNLTTKLDLGELSAAKEKLIEFLNYFDFKEKTIENVNQQLKYAFKTLEFEAILQNLCEKTEIFSKQILLSKSIETIENVFDEIEKFYSGACLDVVADVFFHVGEVCKISNLPLTLDAIKIVDANNFCERFNNLYVLGCSADNAPSFKADCGIIVDDEIAELNFKHKLSPTIAHINKLARLRLLNSCLNFRQTLTLAYSRTQSELVKEFCARLTNKNAQKLQPSLNLLGQYVAISKQDFIEKNLIYSTNSAKKFVASKNLSHVSKCDGLKIDTISASRLEDYFKCPFHHFLNYTLKVRERLKTDIMPLDTGNILHEILFEYYSKNKQVGEKYEFAKSQIFKIVEADERLKVNINSPVLVNLIDETLRVLNGVDYIDANSNFKPEKFEYAFNGSSSLNLGSAKLVGKVDRIDSDGTNLRIIDYKTGRAEASLKELYYGNKLQLFLYACAMEKNFRRKVVGEFYLPLHNNYTTEKNNYSLKGFFENTEDNVKNLDNRLTAGDKSDIVNITLSKENLARKYSDKELTTSQMELLKNYAQTVSKQAIHEIESGYILPTPTGVNSPCESCPYNQICLKDSNAVVQRKPKQVDIASFGGEQ